MIRIYHTPIFSSCYLRILFVLLSAIWLNHCSELPSKSEGPDNPLDPANPANSIQGPALILSPTQIKINSGESFQLELWAVEVNEIAGVSTRIDFDPEVFSIDHVDELGEGYVIPSESSSVDSFGTGTESFLLQNNGKLIFLYDIDTENGYLNIDCAVVESDPASVSGSGPIAKITFKHIPESTETGVNLDISGNSRVSDDQSVYTNVEDRRGSEIHIN